MKRPFVGRTTELASLEQRLAGGGGVVLIAGPAGIGKTALVNETLTRYVKPPWRVTRGFCANDVGAPPLWPWHRALRLAGVSQDTDAQPPDSPHELAAARFRRLSHAAERLCAIDEPLLVVLEDLHWADSASLDLLRHVTQQAFDSKLMVLATSRDPLTDLNRYGVETLRLSPFTTVEIGQFLNDTTDAEAISLRTGGLPLLVSAVGDDIGSVVSGLLAAVPVQQQAILFTAATLSEEVDEELLSAVTGSAVTEALESGANAGLLTRVEGHYRMAHALYQEALAAKATSPAEIHRRAAEALTGKGSAAQIAAHWRRAGDGPQTARWSRAAATQAMQGYAVDEAIGHLANAHAAAPQDPEPLIELATAEYLGSRYDDSLRHCGDAAEMARRANQPELIAAAALVIRSVTFNEAGQVIVGLCRLALSYPDIDPVLRARLLAQMATMQSEMGELGEAGSTARQAIELAERAGDPLAELDAIQALAMGLSHPDDVHERLRLADLAVSLAQGLGDSLSVVIGQTWRVNAGYQLGRLDISDSAIGAIASVAGRRSLPLPRWHHFRVLAARALLEGDWATARSCNAEAMKLAAGSGDTTAAGMSFVVAHRIAELRQDPSELLPAQVEVLSQAPMMPLIVCELGNLHVLLGDMGEARRYYEAVLPAIREPVVDTRWGGVLSAIVPLIETFADRQTGELVAEHLRPWAKYPGSFGTSTAYYEGSVSQLLGRLALLSKRFAEAETWLRAAISHNISLRAWPYAVLSKLDLARCLIAQGKDPRSVIAEAATEARRLDMLGAIRAAERLQAKQNQDDPLSVREREVANLVLQALSNRQIAERLVLSERTVESHVRNILLKLNCANRSEYIARFK